MSLLKHGFICLTGLLILLGCQGEGGDAQESNVLSVFGDTIPVAKVYTQKVNVTNGSVSLSNVTFPIELNTSNFDFNTSCANGSGIRFYTVSDENTSGVALNSWVEFYDNTKQAAKIWVSSNSLETGLTTLQMQHSLAWCEENTNVKTDVFTNLIDRNDVENWVDTNTTSVDNIHVKQSVVSNKTMPVNDSNYNFVPDLLIVESGQTGTGEQVRKYILTWTKKRYHVDQYYDIMVMIGYQVGDQRVEWGEPKSIYSGSPDKDPFLFRTADNVIHNCFIKRVTGGEVEQGLACARSLDDGDTWSFPLFLAAQPSDIYVVDQFVEVEQELYIVAQGRNFVDNTNNTALWRSTDNGITWTQVSEIVPYGSPYMESALAYSGNGNFIVVSRGISEWGDGTYKFTSNDFGRTWSNAVNIIDQVGTVHYPTLMWMGNKLVLLGREAITDFDGANSNTALKQFGLFISDDKGMTFQNTLLIDDYRLGRVHDGGYGHLLPMNDNKAFVTYCADKSGDYMPSILVAEVDLKKEEQKNGLYFTEGFTYTPAKREFHFLNESSEMVLHFKLLPTLGGNHFEISFLDDLGSSPLGFNISSSSGDNNNLIMRISDRSYDTGVVLDDEKSYTITLRTDMENAKLAFRLMDDQKKVLNELNDINISTQSLSSISSLSIGSIHKRRSMGLELSYLYQVGTAYENLSASVDPESKISVITGE